MPQGYKMTSLGVIPQDWEEKKLGDIAEINPRNGEITSQFVTFLTMSDISEHGGIIKENIIPNISLKPGFTSFKKGDIIIAKITPCFENGKGALLDNITEEYGFGSTEFHVIRSRQCNHFIYFHTISYAFRKRLESQMTGSAGQKRVPADSVSSYKLPVPPLPEQQKIAEVLGTWDKAIEKQSQLIKKLELRKKGLMQQLLTAKRRLPGFSEPWKKVRFCELFIKVIKTADPLKKYEVLSVTKEGIFSQKLYFNKDIASEDTSKYIVVERGDLAMSGLNFWMGSCHILTNFDEGIISPAYKVFKVDKHNNIDFIKDFVQSSMFLQALQGSSVIGASVVRRNLDKEMLYEWTFKIPSITEQTAIAQVLTAADREIELAQQKLELLRQQKRGLMQQLLTGKKRVKI